MPLYTAFLQQARFPWMTCTVVLVCLGVFLSAEQGGLLHHEAMIDFGAKVGPLILDLGQTWRLLTANLLHRDAIHLGLNLFVLLNVGSVLENVLCRLDYLWLLIVTSVATMASSLVFNDAITIGSSGLVFGCLGALVAFGLRFRKQLPPLYRRILSEAAIPATLGLLSIGLRAEGVDNWAHVSGFLVGMFGGAVSRPQHVKPLKLSYEFLRAVPLLTIALGVLLGTEILFPHLLPRLELRVLGSLGARVAIPAQWTQEVLKKPGVFAWNNGLSDTGRARFSIEDLESAELAAPQERAQDLMRLDPDFNHAQIETFKIDGLDALRLRSLRSPGTKENRTVIWAYFIPRGTHVFECRASWPEAYGAYEQVVQKMMAQFALIEPDGLSQVRSQVMLFPHAPELLARLGILLLEVGEFGPASSAFRAAIAGTPSVVEYRVGLALALSHDGDLEGSCRVAEEALAYNAVHAGALEAKARCEFSQGHVDEALRLVQAAHISDPSNPRFLKSIQRLEALDPK
jgi:rhomboid protease GluP